MKRLIPVLLVICLLVTVVPLRGNAETGKKLVALTFDDGPSKITTSALLDGLKERNVHVTFFTVGKNASYNPDIIKRAYEDGHEIGSHSWDHPELTSLSNSEVESQFARSFEALDAACGKNASYLVRAPYGSTSARVREVINRPLIDWGVDTRDWEVLNTYSVRDNIIRYSYDGAIVLCHDIHNSTVNGALLAIDKMLADGYEFVTVSELFRRRGVELKNQEIYFSCRPTGVDLGPIPKPVVTATGSGGQIRVTITAQGDAPVYYTTDGTVPVEGSAKYNGPFLVDYGTQIKAVAAYKLNGSRSECTSFDGNLGQCPQPQINISGDILSFACSSPNALVYYTLDGSKPEIGAANTIIYRSPVTIKPNTQIRAVAGGENLLISPEVTHYFTKASNVYDVSAYRNERGFTAPKKDGFVFAGWFTDAALTQPLGQDVRTGNAHAKFVDEDVLRVKWQLSAASANGSRNLRLLTSVDSLLLHNVGFDVETPGKVLRNLTTKTVYSQITGFVDGRNQAYKPSIFSADSQYFMAMTMTGIPTADFGAEIKVTPKWTTLDGTQVVGEPLTIVINDAI